MLTKTKDTEYLVLSNLDDRSLLNYCKTAKSAKKICNDDNFWKLRFINKFGERYMKYKSEEKSWKQFYLEIVSFLDVDDIEEIELLSEEKYTDYLKEILLLSLDKPDVFDFFEHFLPQRTIPVFLERESAKKILEKIGNIIDIQKIHTPLNNLVVQLLYNDVSSVKILKNILEKLNIDINDIKIKHNLSREEELYLLNEMISKAINIVEYDPNFLNKNAKTLYN